MKYEKLSKETEKRIIEAGQKGEKSPYAFSDENVIRRNPEIDHASVLRPAFVRDIDKIIHCPYYNRYADKTQVFSFYKNDDLTRRALHVQLVSRIARNIGRPLGLNLDLIEAISLGHDIGHAPFAHAGEKILDELYAAHTGRHFCHNIQSVRVLDQIFPYNISLQTLNGIASHDGEMEMDEYYPRAMDSFEVFDEMIEGCTLDKEKVRELVPSTLEGCVVRISDIIAYIGKDRQDAERAKLTRHDQFEESTIGTLNAEIINNMVVNIVENSFHQPYIRMDEEHFSALQKAKAENYAMIYDICDEQNVFCSTIQPMMEMVYEKLLKNLKENDESSPIFRHHLDFLKEVHYDRKVPYTETEPNQIVVDYIASMTDDYFVDLFAYLFPESSLSISYKGYF